MNTSDNPGLWDIQFSSWDFCESNAKVMSLINRLNLGFRASHDVREGTQTSGHHAPVTNSDFGRLLMRLTPHMRVLHALSLWQAITDRQRFSLSLVSLTRKPEAGHTTHTAWQLWHWTPSSTSGILHLHGPAFQCLTLISEASWSFLLLNWLRSVLMTVSLTTQASPEFI